MESHFKSIEHLEDLCWRCSAVVLVNLGFDLDDGVDQETDHVALVRAHRLVHPGNLVASVSFDSEMKKKFPSYLIILI